MALIEPRNLYYVIDGVLTLRYCRHCGEYIIGSHVWCEACKKIYCWDCGKIKHPVPKEICEHLKMRNTDFMEYLEGDRKIFNRTGNW